MWGSFTLCHRGQDPKTRKKIRLSPTLHRSPPYPRVDWGRDPLQSIFKAPKRGVFSLLLFSPPRGPLWVDRSPGGVEVFAPPDAVQNPSDSSGSYPRRGD